MHQKNWTVKFLDKEYNAWYVKERDLAIEIIGKLSEKDVLFGIDTETQALPKYRFIHSDAALDVHRSTVRLLQIFDGKNAIVLDMNYVGEPDFLIPFLESNKFIAHNALFDLKHFIKMGCKQMNIGCTYVATKLMYHAIYADDSAVKASLEAVVKALFKEDISKQVQKSDWSVDELTFEQVEYASRDPIACLLIAEKIVHGLQKHSLLNIYSLYKKAQWPLALMEMTGMGFNADAHREMIGQWKLDGYAAKKEVLELTGLPELTAQKIAHYLQENLDPQSLAVWPYTETSAGTDKPQLSTDAHTLADFSHIPLVKPFSKFQKATTLASNFGTKLVAKVNPETHRLHTSFMLCGARTGRLSSKAPNLQNAPRDKSFRSLFVARPYYKLVIADFSQIELRVAANLSQDPNMLKAYRDGIDLHKLTASKVSNKPLDAVTKEERQLAKAINFGLLFGLGKTKFSVYARHSYGVDVSEAEAEQAINIFRELYPVYREWQLKQAEIGKSTLRVTTPTGKWRKLPPDNTFGNSMNQPVQGGAAEVMFNALIEFAPNVSEDIQMCNVIHDEIVLEAAIESADTAARLLTEAMVRGYLNVFPNGITRDLVEAKIVDNWGEK